MSFPMTTHATLAPPPGWQVMEELIAKSKAFKAEKAQQREEDLVQTEALDAAFADLLAAGPGTLAMRPKGVKR